MTTQTPHRAKPSAGPIRVRSVNLTVQPHDTTPRTPTRNRYSRLSVRQQFVETDAPSYEVTADLVSRLEPCLRKQLLAIAEPASLEYKEPRLNVILSGYDENQVGCVLNRFLTPKEYIRYKYPRSYECTINGQLFRITFTSTVGVPQFVRVVTDAQSETLYVLVVDATYKSQVYAEAFIDQLVAKYNETFLKQICVAFWEPNASFRKFCKDNNIVASSVEEMDYSIARVQQYIFHAKKKIRRVQTSRNVLILGDFFVGKTSLFNRLTGRKDGAYDQTEKLTGQTAVVEQLRDCMVYDSPGTFMQRAMSAAPQDRLAGNTAEIAADACIELLNAKDLTFDIIIVMYDLMRIQTLEYATTLVDRVHKRHPQSRIILLGNKADLLEQYNIDYAPGLVRNANLHTLCSCRKFSADFFSGPAQGSLMSSLAELKAVKNVKTVDTVIDVVERYDERKQKSGSKRLVRLDKNVLLIGESHKKFGKKPVEIFVEQTTKMHVLPVKSKSSLLVFLPDRTVQFIFETEKKCLEWRDMVVFNVNQVFQ